MDADRIREFGKKVKSYLRASRITIQDFARNVPLDYSTLSKFLNGKYRTPTAYIHIQNIIKSLALREAIYNKGQATELLDIVDCPHFSESDWQAFPLSKLKSLPLTTIDTAPTKRFSKDQDNKPAPIPQVIQNHSIHAVTDTEPLSKITGKPTSQDKFPIFMVEDLPEGFVARSQEYEAARRLLLDNKRDKPTVITTMIHGAGGYGKTTLARALCHDQAINVAFPDGILWVTMGENPGNLTGKVEDLIYILSKERPAFTSIEAATAWLKKLLEDRAFLIVIDDVWHTTHLNPFLQGGPHCSRLITTRNENILPANARYIRLDAMHQNEAIELISFGLDLDNLSNKEYILRELVKRLGRWPLLLTLASGILRERVNRYHQNISSALTYLHKALDKYGITAFDSKNTQERNLAVALTLEVSFSQLRSDELSRYQALAIFPEDMTIPLATLHRLWGMVYNLQKQFLDTYRITRWSDLPLEEPYLWQHLAYHLLGAEQEVALIATVKDLLYIAKKTLVCGISSVEVDLQAAEAYAQSDTAFIELKKQIIRIGHLLGQRDTLGEVQCILVNRLCHIQELAYLCQEFENEITRPFLKLWHPLPDLPSLALIRTLWGHLGAVWGCAVSPEGDWIVSASYDRTLKIWDAQTGEERLTLRGHKGGVHGCAISSQGNLIASASGDRTLKIWDVHQGKCIATFHAEGTLSCCTFLPDDEHIIAGGDGGLYFLHLIVSENS